MKVNLKYLKGFLPFGKKKNCIKVKASQLGSIISLVYTFLESNCWKAFLTYFLNCCYKFIKKWLAGKSTKSRWRGSSHLPGPQGHHALHAVFRYSQWRMWELSSQTASHVAPWGTSLVQCPVCLGSIPCDQALQEV